MINIPSPILEKLDELEMLVEENPVSIPLRDCADFLGMNADSLRRSLEMGQCPFGIGWQKQEGGNRAFKIPTVTFWLWYTAGQAKGVM